VLIAAAIVFRKFFVPEPGFPGYFVFLVVGALGPSAILLPSALPVINWRALSLTLFFILLMSLMWEATLGIPYGWWGFQDAQMLGIRITAWSRLPIEEVVVWIAVTYATAIVYEVIRRWQASGRRMRHAFLGAPATANVEVNQP
jgi:lycopene cyclase domain-containing protein